MKLKKVNAVLALLSTLALIIHIGYNTFSYLTFFYSPYLKTLTTLPFIIFCCAHAICGMCSLFFLSDGTKLDIYQRENRQTIIQRITAAFIFPLLVVHLKTFDLLKSFAISSNWVPFIIVIIIQILFFGVAISHACVSFSKALITLGILKRKDKLDKVNTAADVIGFVLFVGAVYAVISGEVFMFVMK